jgi:uncharacterized protein with von Willebrand factor type A (vWA) domain
LSKINHRVGTVLSNQVRLQRRVDSGQHARAQSFRDLDGCQPDAASRTRNQHRFVATELPTINQREIRRLVHKTHRCRIDERHGIRNRMHPVGWRTNLTGITAVFKLNNNAIADPQ